MSGEAPAPVPPASRGHRAATALLAVVLVAPGLAAVGWALREGIAAARLQPAIAAAEAELETLGEARRLNEEIRLGQGEVTRAVDVTFEFRQGKWDWSPRWALALSALEPEATPGPVVLVPWSGAVELRAPFVARALLQAEADALCRRPEITSADVIRVDTETIALRIVARRDPPRPRPAVWGWP